MRIAPVVSVSAGIILV